MVGIPGEIIPGLITSSASYRISNSLRLRSSASAYLNRALTTSGNRQTWTYSLWTKKASNSGYQTLLDLGGSGNGPFRFYNSGANATNTKMQFYMYNGSYFDFNVESLATYRDPSAWYHIVLVFDSTNATASDRIRLYVNGVRQTLQASTTNAGSDRGFPDQNYSGGIMNSTYPLRIGADPGSFFYDGYIADVNFIDGQALTPSSFGETDVVTGVWNPKRYTGTYGTNGFYLPFNTTTATGFSSYYASFNGSNQYLSMADSAAFDLAASDFTVEAWVNPSSAGGATSRNVLNQSNSGAGSNSSFYFGAGSDGVALYLSTSGTSWTNFAQTSIPVPVGQWSHVVWQRRGNTLEIYLNGSLQAVTGGSSSFSGTVFNSSRSVEIGTQNAAACWFHGSISNLRLVKGTAVYTSNFTPPTSASTAVTNTQLLTLQNATFVDNSTNNFSITNNNSVTLTSSTVGNYWTITKDSSGNYNDWYTNNISLTAGATYDSMIDSPTPYADGGNGRGNYAVLNPLTNGSYTTLSGGNLNTIGNTATNNGNSRSNFAVSNGLWYAEFTVTAINSTYPQYGIMQSSDAQSPSNGSTGQAGYLSYQNSVAYYATGGKIIQNTTSAYGGAFSVGDVIGIALDATNGAVYFSKNGTWQNSGVPTSGSSKTGAALTWTGGTAELVMAIAEYNGSGSSANFGQRPFSYTPPSGFSALNTYNLPSATINNGAKHFAVNLFSGNSSVQTVNNAVNGISMQPDLVWFKTRSNASDSALLDSVRAGTPPLFLSSTTTAAEASTGGGESMTYNSNGFTVISNNQRINLTGYTYVAWQWKGGGTAITNNSGSVTSQVSANPSAGFSVVTYTESGTYTVGHGLGVAPSMILLKERNAVGNWIAWHNYWTAPTTRGLYLNGTNAAFTTGSNWLNSTTSTVFGITGGQVTSGSSQMVAYCFAAVRGYSAFGSYTGNGSTDGPFVYTGFRPRWVMIKETVTVSNWNLWDSSRNPANVTNLLLRPNSSGAESTAGSTDIQVDFLSNGFKIRGSSTDMNTNGETIIYAAFAENPFNISRAR